jgi:hypothetical protein
MIFFGKAVPTSPDHALERGRLRFSQSRAGGGVSLEGYLVVAGLAPAIHKLVASKA